MNSSQSTYLAHNPSFRQQVHCMSSFQQPSRFDKESTRKITRDISRTLDITVEEKKKNRDKQCEEAIVTAANVKANKVKHISSGLQQVMKNRKEKLEIYKEIDREYFNPDKATNPMQFIDNNQQKIMINPNIPYVSTSQNEIFERRMLKNQKEYLNKLNPYIAAPEDDQE